MYPILSYCCHSVVYKNKNTRIDLIASGVLPKEGYHCSNCQRQLQMNGSPYFDRDIKDWEEFKNGISDSPIPYWQNGFGEISASNRSLNVYGRVYKQAILEDFESSPNSVWVIYDKHPESPVYSVVVCKDVDDLRVRLNRKNESSRWYFNLVSFKEIYQKLPDSIRVQLKELSECYSLSSIFKYELDISSYL